MIKGTQRRIIMVKDTESPYFDSAYFVIKSDVASHRHDGDLISEANRMIEAYKKDIPAYESKKSVTSKKGLIVIFSIVTLLSGFCGFMLNIIF